MPEIANTILTDVSLALLERAVSTTLTANVSAGSNTVNVGSTASMYVGAKLIVGSGVTREVITLTAVGVSSITATFAFGHSSGEVVYGTTFPSGQTDHPLFTQAELLAYLTEVQNEFLLAVRPLYTTENLSLLSGNRFVNKPATAIRIERIAINNMHLEDVSVTELDMLQTSWFAQPGSPPEAFFEDKIDPDLVGFHGMPAVNLTAEAWFALRAGTSLNLDTQMTLPDLFHHYLKYGVLSRCWSKDGEQRDPMRASYCRKRFILGILLTLKFIEGLEMVTSRTQLPLPDFRKMPTIGVR
jgi:hypothetical protein